LGPGAVLENNLAPSYGPQCSFIFLDLAWGSTWALDGSQSVPWMDLNLEPAWISNWAPGISPKDRPKGPRPFGVSPLGSFGWASKKAK